MYILLLTLLTATINTSAISPIEQRFLNPNAILHQMFEIMRQTIKSGSPEMNIPILDPMKFQKEEVIMDTNLLSFKANLTVGVFRGLGDFQLNNLTYIREDLAMDVDINVPKLTLEADYYEMNGFIFDKIPISGKGELRYEIRNLDVSSRIFLEQSENGKSSLIKKFEGLRFTAQTVVSHTEFGGNLDCIVNNIVKDVIASYFTRFNKYIATTYSPYIKKFANQFLDKFDSWRIISNL